MQFSSPIAEEIFGTAIRCLMTSRYEEAQKLFTECGMPQYVQIAKANRMLEEIVVRRTVSSYIDENTPISELSVNMILEGDGKPFSTLILLLISPLGMSAAQYDTILSGIFYDIKEHPVHLQQHILAWCHYVSAIINMRKLAHLKNYQHEVEMGYTIAASSLGSFSRNYEITLEATITSHIYTFKGLALALPSTTLRQLSSGLESTYLCNGKYYHFVIEKLRDQTALSAPEARALCISAIAMSDIPLLQKTLLWLGDIFPDANAMCVANMRASYYEGTEVTYTDHLDAGGFDTVSEFIVDGKISKFKSTIKYLPIRTYDLKNFEILDPSGTIIHNGALIIDSYANGKINFDQSISSQEGAWLHTKLQYNGPLIFQDDISVILKLPSNNLPEDLGDDVLLFPDNFPTLRNHAHWLLDGLPRIQAAMQSRSPDCRLVFLDQITPFQADTLEKIGINLDRIFVISNVPHPIKVNAATVVMPHALNIWQRGGSAFALPPSAIEGIRAALFPQSDDAPRPSKRIYMSRKTRSVINEEDISQILDEKGFETIDVFGKDLETHLDAFKDADLFVSPGGAGLANMLFMPRGSTVIALYGEFFIGYLYAQLADILGIHYITILGHPKTFSTHDKDFAISLDDLNMALEMYESRQQTPGLAV